MKLVCTSCSKTYECNCGAPQPIGSVAKPCAKKQGAIIGHVTDDLGRPIPGVPILKNGTGEDTGPKGVVAFDPLDAGAYTIDLGNLGKLAEQYDRPVGETKRSFTLSDGEFAYAPYELTRKAALKVLVRWEAHKKFFGGAKARASGSAGALPDPGPTNGGTGIADFRKVSAGSYDLHVSLLDDDARHFRTTHDFAAPLPVTLGPGDDETVIVEVEPLPKWIAVRVVDATGAVATGVKVRIVQPDGNEVTRTLARADLDADGCFRLENLLPGKPGDPWPGKCKVSLPDLDQELWEPGSAPQGPARFAEQPERKPVTGSPYEVAAGDCTWRLAVRHGVTSDAIWNEGANKAYTDQYKNRDTLLPGAKLTIPPPRIKEVECDLERCHEFKLKEAPREMTVKLLRGGDPVPQGTRCIVKFPPSTDPLERSTVVDGSIRFPVPHEATVVTIEPPENVGLPMYKLALGALPPIESPLGVQHRLANLGYYMGDKSGAKTDEYDKAVKAFQRSRGLEALGSGADGAVNAETQDKLVAACGV